MQNLNKANHSFFAPVSGWHALVLQDVMQLLLFLRDGCTPVNGEILPQTFIFFLFPPAEGNRDASIGLSQCEKMTNVWLDFLKNISLRFTASVIRS